MKKQIFGSVSLMIAMLAAAGLGCISCASGSENPTQTNTVNTTEAVTEAAVITDERDLIRDELGAFDFGGDTFRTIVQKYCVDDIWVKEETGDILSDAVYRRNAYVADRFNLVFSEPANGTEGEVKSMVGIAVKAGDDVYDLVLGQMEHSGGQATEGVFLNWYDIPHLDFDKPWYPKSIIDNAASVNGKMYVMMSDMLLSSTRQTWAFIYDKTVAANYDIPELYDTVREGKWTLDKLTETLKGVYQDLNGSGTYDDDDYYGMSISLNDCMLAAFYYGFDQRFAELNEDGTELVTLIASEKGAEITKKLHDLIYNNSDVFCVDEKQYGMKEKFLSGTSLFIPFQIGGLTDTYRDYENEFGVLPLPKWDEAQAEYNSVMDAGCSIIAVPTTASKTEMIGVVTEALSAYSWREVIPTFYDIVFDVKGVRDEGSAEMLDIILDNRVIDFAYLYDNWNGWTFQLGKLIKNDKFASQIESVSKRVQKHYEKILESFVD